MRAGSWCNIHGWSEGGVEEREEKEKKISREEPAKDEAAGGGTMARLMHQLVQVCLNAPLFMAQDLPKTRTFKTLSLLHCVELCNVIFGSVEF